MKTRQLVLLLLLAGLDSLAQTPVVRKAPRRPDANGIANFYIDSLGRGRFVEKSGPAKILGTDTSAINGLGKKLAIQDQTINKRTAFMSMAGLHTFTPNSASPAPDIINATDSLRGGIFIRRSGAAAHDGVINIRDASNNLYVRQLPERRITPQMFGAIPDDGIDDWAALNAWINYVGFHVEHYLPAGTYISSDSLVRTDKGGFYLKGVFSQSIIQFTGNSQGMVIKNILNHGQYGPISIDGVELQSTGTKTGNQDGLRIVSEHEQYPGPSLNNIVIRCVGYGSQWAVGLHYHNTGHSNNFNINIYGSNQDNGTGLILSTDEQRSSVEHNFNGWTIFNWHDAVLLDSPLSTPQGHGNEGIQFTNGSAYALFNGFRGVVANRAPMIGFTKVHVATQGGYAMHMDGYTDLSFHGVELQVYTSPTGVIPPYAMHLGNLTFATGDIRVFVRGNLPIGTELKGVSGGIHLEIGGSWNSAQTYFIKQDSDCDAIVDAGGVWTNEPATFTNWGSVPHPPLTVLGGGVGKVPVISSAAQPNEGDVLRFGTTGNRYVYEPVKPHLTDISAYTVVGGGVQTVSMSNFDAVYITGSASTTLVIDRSTAAVGKKITIVRYDEGSTGPVTIRSDAPTFNLFQDATDAFFKSSIMLPMGIRPQTWTYTGVFKLIAGGTSLNPANNLSDVPDKAVARDNLLLGSAATQPASAFVAASGGFIAPSYTTTITATSGWVSSTYNEIVPENTMLAGHTYLLQVRVVKPGSDQANFDYLIPAELGWTGYGTHPDLKPLAANYYASPTRGIKVRFQTSTSGGVTGLQMTFTSTDSQGAIVEAKLAPLL